MILNKHRLRNFSQLVYQWFFSYHLFLAPSLAVWQYLLKIYANVFHEHIKLRYLQHEIEKAKIGDFSQLLYRWFYSNHLFLASSLAGWQYLLKIYSSVFYTHFKLCYIQHETKHASIGDFSQFVYRSYFRYHKLLAFSLTRWQYLLKI